MHKQYSFQLPRVSPDPPREQTLELINEQVAQQSLIQISKNEDSPKGRDSFWREMSKLNPASKRYDPSSLTLPKKRQVELMPAIDIKSYRQSNHDLNLQFLNTTSYMVIDDREGKKLQQRCDKKMLQEHVNRKAKFLFRSRNKSKLPSLSSRDELFSSSFYCSKLLPSQEGLP